MEKKEKGLIRLTKEQLINIKNLETQFKKSVKY